MIVRVVCRYDFVYLMHHASRPKTSYDELKSGICTIVHGKFVSQRWCLRVGMITSIMDVCGELCSLWKYSLKVNRFMLYWTKWQREELMLEIFGSKYIQLESVFLHVRFWLSFVQYSLKWFKFHQKESKIQPKRYYFTRNQKARIIHLLFLWARKLKTWWEYVRLQWY